MSEHKISANSRKDEGKGASRRLRHAGLIPAVIYGGNAAPQSIQLHHEKTWLASQHEWFYSSILDLEVDGTVQKALLRDIQRHPYKQLIMHLDFQRVDENQALRTAVPLHFLNEDKSPAGKSAEVVVTHELNEVVVECLPKDLPEFLEVDLTNLAVGQIVHLSDLVLPAGHVARPVGRPAAARGRQGRLRVRDAHQQAAVVEQGQGHAEQGGFLSAVQAAGRREHARRLAGQGAREPLRPGAVQEVFQGRGHVAEAGGTAEQQARALLEVRECGVGRPVAGHRGQGRLRLRRDRRNRPQPCAGAAHRVHPARDVRCEGGRGAVPGVVEDEDLVRHGSVATADGAVILAVRGPARSGCAGQCWNQRRRSRSKTLFGYSLRPRLPL